MLHQGHHETLLAASRYRRPEDGGAHAKTHEAENPPAAGLAMDGHWAGTGLAAKYVMFWRRQAELRQRQVPSVESVRDGSEGMVQVADR